MRTQFVICLLSALSVFAAGCYDDKGNYDYSDVNELVIDMNHAYTYAITLGETFELNPEIRFVNGEGDISRLTYKWYLGEDNYTQDDWNTLKFRWTPEKLLSNQELCLEVTDPVTGIQYLASINCFVESQYQDDGVMILSEEDGKTRFSFVKIPAADRYDDSRGRHFYKYVEYKNAYLTGNDEELPAGPLMLHQHFCADDSTVGQILILTENGAIDIDGKAFQKDPIGELSSVFLDGTYPAELGHVTDAMFMARVDLVADTEGRLYSRLKNTSELFHSGYFFPNRLSLDNEELSGCRLIPAPFDGIKSCLVYDTDKKRLLVIGDSGGVSGAPDAGAGHAFALAESSEPSSSTPGSEEAYVPVNDLSGIDDLLWIGYSKDFGVGYTLVFEKNGRYYCQEFELNKNYSSFRFTVNSPTINEIKGLPQKPDCVYAAAYKDRNPLVYLAVGNQLYIYDRSNPTLPVKAYNAAGFRADIVDMDGEGYNSPWLALALSDGSVLVLNSWKSNEESNKFIYYDSKKEMIKRPERPESDTEDLWEETAPVTFGKIRDIRFKIQPNQGWTVPRS